MKSVATLIVSPGAICEQWMQEIEKHVEEGALRVSKYLGVNSKQKFLNPDYFTQYDVVITTFEILRSELLHTNLHQDMTDSPSQRAKGLRSLSLFHEKSLSSEEFLCSSETEASRGRPAPVQIEKSQEVQGPSFASDLCGMVANLCRRGSDDRVPHGQLYRDVAEVEGC